MELMTARGMRDFSPSDMIIRNNVINSLTRVFERYGFSPLETPVIERYDVLSAKFAAGEESDAMKETFKLRDQGERELGLRFDFTVPFARFIGMNPTLNMPFKRYQLGPVFRDGPIKLGRYREFWQCDVDTAGSNSMLADAECILLALDAFKELKIDAFLVINNRKLLQGLLLDSGVPQDKLSSAIIAIDKMDKIGESGVKEELSDRGISSEIIDRILESFSVRGNNKEMLGQVEKTVKSDIGKEGVRELKELLEYVDGPNVVLSLSLARGLSYYTGPVFEGYLRGSQITSSICGGGRYDKMIGMYLGSSKEIAAIGISFGLDVICEAMKLAGAASQETVARVFIIPIGTQKECLKIATQLREAGVNTAVDIIGRGISKNMKYADAMKIPYVIIVGEDELKQKKVKLRDMKSGKEEIITAKQAKKKLSVKES